MGNIISIKKDFKSSSKCNRKTITTTTANAANAHAPLKYYVPNFVKDTDIMVILHFLGRYLFQNIFSAPIEEILSNECKVLDVGCGPGTWLLDLAAVYKSSNFTGVDLFPVYPIEIKPHNVNFMQCDVLSGLPYDDDTFDYVHQGNMLSVYSIDEWQFVISELVRVCKPGGYLEFTEPELSTNTGPILTRFYEALVELSDSRNVKIRISREIIKILKSLPTVQNVEYKTSTVSLGYTKGGNAGQAYFEVHDGFFLNEPMPDSLSKIMGMSKRGYLELFNEAKKEVDDGIAPDCDLYRIWCRKA